jgi:hypothetical protein
VFVVGGGVGGGRFRLSRIPFGWKYSPSLCQRLVAALTRRALAGLKVKAWVYLDDILFSSTSKRAVRKAGRRLVKVFQAAGFLISPKSEFEPSPAISFIGKCFDATDRSISNMTGMLKVCLAAWVLLWGRGEGSPRCLRSFLGRLIWVGRPRMGLGSFLGGAFRALERHHIKFSPSLCRATATVLCFGFIPILYDPLPSPSHRHLLAGRHSMTLFVDAAEDALWSGRFRVGAYAKDFMLRSFLCPEWVTTLQQAELFGLYWGCKTASHIGFKFLYIGTDSEVARFQTLGFKASCALRAQLRILRRLFWLFSWSSTQVLTFRVESALNPADPPSRVDSFPSISSVQSAAVRRFQLWERGPSPYLYLSRIGHEG